MKIRLAVAILALASSSTAMAQSKPIKVKVLPVADAESQEVADRLSGQIGSSSRYALVTEKDSETVLLGLNCLPNTMLNGQQIGVTCDSEITYWPVSTVPLSVPLTGYLAAASNESDVAQRLFDDFVEETSDEKLNQKAAVFKKELNSIIAAYPKGVASLHQSSKFRNTRARLAATAKNPTA
jgi:hypothetical protein